MRKEEGKGKAEEKGGRCGRRGLQLPPRHLWFCVSVHRYTPVRSGVIYVHAGRFLRLLAKTAKTKQEAGWDQLSSCASRTRVRVCKMYVTG